MNNIYIYIYNVVDNGDDDYDYDSVVFTYVVYAIMLLALNKDFYIIIIYYNI